MKMRDASPSLAGSDVAGHRCGIDVRRFGQHFGRHRSDIDAMCFELLLGQILLGEILLLKSLRMLSEFWGMSA
jgi:hypothetical protein